MFAKIEFLYTFLSSVLCVVEFSLLKKNTLSNVTVQMYHKKKAQAIPSVISLRNMWDTFLFSVDLPLPSAPNITNLNGAFGATTLGKCSNCCAL